MIGQLPKALLVDGEDCSIRSDFRVALLIFQAFDDPELSDYEKVLTCLECLYETVPTNIEAAYKQAAWFLDGGNMKKSRQAPKKLLDWEQDESIIFPAVNKVAGFETRTAEYIHWWTFLGYFSEIGEGMYSSVMSIREKKAKGKKLEKYEQEFYREHKEIIDIKRRYTAEEQAELERLNKLLS